MGRTTHPRLTLDPRLLFARIYHLQRFQREQALRLQPAAHHYVPRHVARVLLILEPFTHYSLRMDLYDDDESPNIAAMLELPGVDRRNLSLRVQGTKLIVHGERGSPLAARVQHEAPAQRDTHLSAENYKIRELKFGHFHREIDIPAGMEVCF